MSDKLNSFGITLKKLRKSQGLTQEEFSKAFSLPCGTHMTIYTIRNWEQGRTIPENSTIEALCDFFRCDRDALFGTIDCSTHDYEFICRTTGLTEKAVRNLAGLASFQQGVSLTQPLSVLIEQVDFSRILADISLYMQNTLTTEPIKSAWNSMWTFCVDELEKAGFQVTFPKTIARYHYENAAERLKRLLDQICEDKNVQVTAMVKKAFTALTKQNGDELDSIIEDAITELGMSREKATEELCRRIDQYASCDNSEKIAQCAGMLKEYINGHNGTVNRMRRMEQFTTVNKKSEVGNGNH